MLAVLQDCPQFEAFRLHAEIPFKACMHSTGCLYTQRLLNGTTPHC